MNPRTQRRQIFLLVISVVLLLGFGTYSMTLGSLSLELPELLAALAHEGTTVSEKIVWDIRLPRVCGAIAVGAALGVSGAVFQSISRNALGSPDIIGFTTGAATGAVAQIMLVDAGTTATAAAAVLTGILTAGLVYGLARRGNSYQLILIGIGVGAILSACNTLLLARGDYELALRARLWLSGSLQGRNWQDIAPAIIGIAIGIPLVVIIARHLTIMEMGDDIAHQLGIPVERIRTTALFLGVSLTAVAVAAAGPIAFVALAGPQIARQLTRSGNVQVWCSGAVGAVLLLAADCLAQALPAQATLPVGLLTGLIGGIYLLMLLLRARV